MYCPGCGAENEDERPLCYQCGTSLRNLAPIEVRLRALRGEGRFLTTLLLLLGAGIALLAAGLASLLLLTPDPRPLEAPASRAAGVELQGAAPVPFPTPTARVLAVGVAAMIVDRDTGVPLTAARLIVNDREVVADEDGMGQIMGLAPGQYVLVAVHPGYAPGSSAILSLASGEVRSVDVALDEAGGPSAAVDPLGSDAVEPGGAPTADDAERLAREQGLARGVVMAEPVTLQGKYWVNYRSGSGLCAAVITLDNEGWALTDEAGEVWRVVKQGGGLALGLPAGGWRRRLW